VNFITYSPATSNIKENSVFFFIGERTEQIHGAMDRIQVSSRLLDTIK